MRSAWLNSWCQLASSHAPATWRRWLACILTGQRFNAASFAYSVVLLFVSTVERCPAFLGRRRPLVRLVMERPAWQPAMHAAFPTRFRQAVQALLLAASGGGRGPRSSGSGPQQQAAAGIWALPSELLLKIVGLAAYPLTPWL